MLAIPMAPTVVTLNPAGGRFDSNLPARLAGVIGPDEFSNSIARINAAYTQGPLGFARLLIFGGLAAWGVCFGIAFASQTDYEGPNITLIMIGIAAMMICSVGGGIWIRAIIAQRIAGLQAAVSAEHNYYNSAQRAQARGPNPLPISWTTIATTFVSYYGYRRSRWNTYCQIQIEVGGGAALLAQPVMMAVGGPQPVQPYQQSYQQQGYQNQGYQNQQYNGAPQYPAQAYGSGGAQPQASGMNAPLLANDHTTSEGHAQAGPITIATCDKCGRTSANPQDHFCNQCGGQFRR